MEVLRDFPKRGVCWDHTAELVSYLIKRDDLHVNPNLQNYDNKPPKGVAWSEASSWGVSVSSHQPEYYIEQLIPFIPDSNYERFRYPVTPDECYVPPKFCLRITPSNCDLIKSYLSDHRDEYVGWLETWNPIEALGLYFCCPQQTKDCYAEPGAPRDYFQITDNSFLKHVLTKQKFPEKWCIENKEDTCKMLTDFLHEHGSEWRDYIETWYVAPNHYYFHYPPISPVGHSQNKPGEGYVLITAQQFKNYVLTHTDKQQQINELKPEENEKQESTSRAIKVQRPHLTVRDTGPIGATGIRCPKIQVKIGSGYLPD